MQARTVALFLLSIIATSVFFVFATVAWGELFSTALAASILLLMVIFMGANVYSLFFGAPFVPMTDANVDEMMLLAGIGPGDRVADLGSGDGRLLIAAASKGAFAEGWEINPVLWLLSLWNVRRAGHSRSVRVHLGSYWGKKLSRFNVVTLYLITTHMHQMQEKLRSELQAGSRVASHRFSFPDWPLEASNGKKTYLYRIPTSVRQS